MRAELIAKLCQNRETLYIVKIAFMRGYTAVIEGICVHGKVVLLLIMTEIEGPSRFKI